MSGEVSELVDERDLVISNPKTKAKQYLDKFLKTRQQGISSPTITYYRRCIPPYISSCPLNSSGIKM